MPESASRQDQRVLLLTLTRRDAEVTTALLAREGIACDACGTMDAMLEAMRDGVGVVVLTDTVLREDSVDALVAAIGQQPAWSDVPILLLASNLAPRGPIGQLLDSVTSVMLLDRPTSTRSMTSAVRSALRARSRQYQLRDYLKALQQADHDMRLADRRKDEFLAMLAHELRNPLAGLVSAHRVLELTNAEDPRVVETLRRANRQTAQLTRLVDDLLEISRISRGKIELRRAPLVLNDAVNQAVDSILPLIHARGHRMTLSLPETPVNVVADQARLVQILENLLSNAARYTPAGGNIALEVLPSASHVDITVSDDGIGIEADEMPRLFQMFGQLKAGYNGPQGGLGIGLALVKKLVDMHGGTVRAASDGRDRGARFTVRLPRPSSSA